MVELELILNRFTSGKGIWKFNNSPLSSQPMWNFINEEKLKYAVPVYDLNHITNTRDKIELNFEDDAILEALFLCVRGETIKCSTIRKKLSIKLEKTLTRNWKK